MPGAKASSTRLRSCLSEWAVRRGDQEARRHVEGHAVRGGEDHARLVGVQPEDVLEHPELLRRAVHDGELPALGAEDLARLGIGARPARQLGPVEGSGSSRRRRRHVVRGSRATAGRTPPAPPRRGRSAPARSRSRRASGRGPRRGPPRKTTGPISSASSRRGRRPAPGWRVRPSRSGARQSSALSWWVGPGQVMGLVVDDRGGSGCRSPSCGSRRCRTS